MCFPSGIPAVESVSHKVLSEKYRHNENQREREKERKHCEGVALVTNAAGDTSSFSSNSAVFILALSFTDSHS